MKKQNSTLKKALFFPVFTAMAMPVFSQSNSLTGTWKLTVADQILPDGRRVADYGTASHGIAIFTADGHYVVEIFRSDRMKFVSGNRTKNSPEAYKAAIRL